MSLGRRGCSSRRWCSSGLNDAAAADAVARLGQALLRRDGDRATTTRAMAQEHTHPSRG